MGPVAEILDQAVLLRIAVDIGDQVHEVDIRLHLDAPERLQKQVAAAVICLVDRLGVGIKEDAAQVAGF